MPTGTPAMIQLRELALRREHVDEAAEVHARADVRRSPGRAPRPCCRPPRAARAQGRQPGRCPGSACASPSPRAPRRAGSRAARPSRRDVNSRFDGSGASSATTPIAPARLWPARSADASTSRFSGSCSPKSLSDLARPVADEQVERDRRDDGEHDPDRADQSARRRRRARARRARKPRASCRGSRSICATSTSSVNPRASASCAFGSSARPTIARSCVDLLATRRPHAPRPAASRTRRGARRAPCS